MAVRSTISPTGPLGKTASAASLRVRLRVALAAIAAAAAVAAGVTLVTGDDESSSSSSTPPAAQQAGDERPSIDSTPEARNFHHRR